jgi:pimeloyl-ACP methyl ester carboxylesterase
MNEKMADVGRGITLAYEEFGAADAEPVVLIAGLGMQLHTWPTPFCDDLAARGYRVVRFDNRDIGRSTHMAYPPPTRSAFLSRRWPAGQYEIADMATDTVGLLDALGIASTHLVGISMGGMIAQTVAATRPERVRTLTSMMSTTGARWVGRPALSTWRIMLERSPVTRDESVDRAVRMFRHIGSHGYPFNEEWIRQQAGHAFDRDPSRAGVARQLAAIFRSGDRTVALRGVAAPTLVIHGDRDRMVHPTGGRATARAIAGARLETILGLGHDLPHDLWPTLLDLIDKHARQSGQRAQEEHTDAPTSS